jgi:hypothetical protein
LKELSDVRVAERSIDLRDDILELPRGRQRHSFAFEGTGRHFVPLAP